MSTLSAVSLLERIRSLQGLIHDARALKELRALATETEGLTGFRALRIWDKFRIEGRIADFERKFSTAGALQRNPAVRYAGRTSDDGDAIGMTRALGRDLDQVERPFDLARAAKAPQSGLVEIALTSPDEAVRFRFGRGSDRAIATFNEHGVPTLRIPDQSISADHAVIQFDPKTRILTITDRGSSNGTYVMGRRISSDSVVIDLKKNPKLQEVEIGAGGTTIRLLIPSKKVPVPAARVATTERVATPVAPGKPGALFTEKDIPPALVSERNPVSAKMMQIDGTDVWIYDFSQGAPAGSVGSWGLKIPRDIPNDRVRAVLAHIGTLKPFQSGLWKGVHLKIEFVSPEQFARYQAIYGFEHDSVKYGLLQLVGGEGAKTAGYMVNKDLGLMGNLDAATMRAAPAPTIQLIIPFKAGSEAEYLRQMLLKTRSLLGDGEIIGTEFAADMWQVFGGVR